VIASRSRYAPARRLRKERQSEGIAKAKAAGISKLELRRTTTLPLCIDAMNLKKRISRYQRRHRNRLLDLAPSESRLRLNSTSPSSYCSVAEEPSAASPSEVGPSLRAHQQKP
jgi:DNA invertase Pin-like site-specific DNA recombinase